jgi:alkyl sulfatase BDS1-like metallo-beta-lactamase superfamily hydrolase
MENDRMGKESSMKRARLRETGTGRETQTPVSPAEGVWMLPGYGNPSNPFSPKRREIHREIVHLVGKDRVIEKVRDLKEKGSTAMALQFVDMVLAAGPEKEEEKEVHRLKGELLGIMGDNEPSYIARNIYYNGHNEEMRRAGVETTL